jgi:hypothetical protein
MRRKGGGGEEKENEEKKRRRRRRRHMGIVCKWFSQPIHKAFHSKIILNDPVLHFWRFHIAVRKHAIHTTRKV